MKNHSQHLSTFLSVIYAKSSFQKKMLQALLPRQDGIFWERADRFAEGILGLLHEQGLTIEYVADSYLNMCHNMLREQIKFKKTGRYSCLQAADAHAEIYSSEKEMSSYMYGLALSQFLWPNHYAIYDFFIKQSSFLTGVRSYLEVGPGHGLFLIEALKLFPTARFLAVDISPVSTRIAASIAKRYVPSANCEFIVDDVNKVEGGEFDYIVMCEVLEHLDAPLATLRHVRSLLQKEGHLFITTCANCPAIDHVYLYESVGHIRKHIREGGFEIVKDLPLPVGDYPESEWENQKVEINYAAMLRRA